MYRVYHSLASAILYILWYVVFAYQKVLYKKYRIAGIFRGRKLSRISRFLNIRESFIREIFGADTVQGSFNIWGAWQIARASCRAAPRAEVSSCSAAGKTSRYQSLMVVMPSSSIRRSCQQGSETDIRVIKP